MLSKILKRGTDTTVFKVVNQKVVELTMELHSLGYLVQICMQVGRDISEYLKKVDGGSGKHFQQNKESLFFCTWP
jgi:hypothetical protein